MTYRLLTSFALAAASRSGGRRSERANQMESPGRLSGRQSAQRKSRAFANDVKAATGGKLQITVHPNASLFKAPEIKRAVQTGQAQMGEILLSIHENEDRCSASTWCRSWRSASPTP